MIKINIDGVQETNRLGFKLDPAIGNISKAVITKFEIVETEVKEFNNRGELSTSDFVGKTIPVLTIEFRQQATISSEIGRDRFYTHRLNPVSQSSLEENAQKRNKTTEDVIIEMYNQQIALLKHLTKQFEDAKGYNAKTIPPNFEFKTIDEHIIAVRELYQYFINLMGGENPCYKNTIIWIKLVADYTTQAFLTIPRYLGEGVFDRYREGVKSYLEIKPNETVKLISRGENKVKSEETSTVDQDILDIIKKHNS